MRQPWCLSMRRWWFTLLLTTICAMAPAPRAAGAGADIQRCVGPDGSTLYTDKACGAYDARATPMPAGLATRITGEQMHEQSLQEAAVPVMVAGTVDAATPLAPPSPDAGVSTTLAPPLGRRSVADGCARTPTQLQMDLRGALALGDVNRIAESYHWVGVSPRSAARIMDRLGRLAREPVADMHYFSASIGSGAQFASADMAIDAGMGGGGGILQVLFGDGSGAHLTDFDVERFKGCYFVRF